MNKKILSFIFCFFLITFSFIHLSHAKYYPDSLWESVKIPYNVLSVQWADFNKDGQKDIIYVAKDRLVFANIEGGTVKPFAQLKTKSFEEFHRVTVGDWNSDGTLEVLVNGFSAGRILSWIFELNGRNIIQKQYVVSLILPFYFNNSVNLYSQDMYSGFRWSKKIHKLKWDGKQYVTAEIIPLKPGIGQQARSLFSLLGIGSRYLEVTSDGRLQMLTNVGEKQWLSGVDYGGPYDFIEHNERDPLGIKRESRYFIQPRMLYNGKTQKVIVVKNEGYLKSALGAVPAMKYAQIVQLSLQDDRLQELKVSPRLDGAVTDIQWIDFNNDGVQELAITLLVRKLGYLDSLRKQDSVILVIPIEKAKTSPELTAEKKK